MIRPCISRTVRAEPRRCFGCDSRAGANAYGGTHAPDIVGNIRVDQAWGLFQISGMAHLVNASYNILGAGGVPTALSEISGHPEDKWGGAVMAALQIKNIPTGPGDDFKIDVSYSKGVTKQVISTSGGSPSFAMFGGTDRAGAYQSVGFGQTADAVYVAWAADDSSWWIHGVSVVRSTTTGIPTGRPACSAATPQVRYGGSVLDLTSAKGAVVRQLHRSARPCLDFTCNPDFNVAQVGVTTRWTPVKNLTFSAEVGAFFLDQKFSGAATLAAAAPKPTTVYEFKDQSTVYLNLPGSA